MGVACLTRALRLTSMPAAPTPQDPVAHEPTPPTESRVRTRTRRAILDAALVVLSANRAASLGEVAAEAGVGRSTLHRYFPERGDLITAIGIEALEQVAAATDRARLQDGPAVDAMLRLLDEHFALGDTFAIVFNEPQLMAEQRWQEETPSDAALCRLIERGRAEGTIDREMTSTWVANLLWTVLYTGWMHVRENGASRFEALELSRRTLRKALAV